MATHIPLADSFERVGELGQHHGHLIDASISPDGRFVSSADQSGVLQIRQATDRFSRLRYFRATTPIRAIKWMDAVPSALLVGCGNGDVHLVIIKETHLTDYKRLEMVQGSVSVISVSESGSLVAMAVGHDIVLAKQDPRALENPWSGIRKIPAPPVASNGDVPIIRNIHFLDQKVILVSYLTETFGIQAISTTHPHDELWRIPLRGGTNIGCSAISPSRGRLAVTNTRDGIDYYSLTKRCYSGTVKYRVNPERRIFGISFISEDGVVAANEGNLVFATIGRLGYTEQRRVLVSKERLEILQHVSVGYIQEKMHLLITHNLLSNDIRGERKITVFGIRQDLDSDVPFGEYVEEIDTAGPSWQAHAVPTKAGKAPTPAPAGRESGVAEHSRQPRASSVSVKSAPVAPLNPLEVPATVLATHTDALKVENVLSGQMDHLAAPNVVSSANSQSREGLLTPVGSAGQALGTTRSRFEDKPQRLSPLRGKLGFMLLALLMAMLYLWLLRRMQALAESLTLGSIANVAWAGLGWRAFGEEDGGPLSTQPEPLHTFEVETPGLNPTMPPYRQGGQDVLSGIATVIMTETRTETTVLTLTDATTVTATAFVERTAVETSGWISYGTAIYVVLFLIITLAILWRLSPSFLQYLPPGETPGAAQGPEQFKRSAWANNLGNALRKRLNRGEVADLVNRGTVHETVAAREAGPHKGKATENLDAPGGGLGVGELGRDVAKGKGDEGGQAGQ